MHQHHTMRLSTWARLLGLALLVGVGLLASLGLATRTAHAQAASSVTITVSTCDESHLDAAITKANTDNANDIITFSCTGDIKLTSTLGITGSMTLDGSGKSVTLDGNNSVQVLSVNSGVSFTLNALTVAHGTSGYGGGLYNNAGTVSISNSTFTGNSATYRGAGLYNNAGTMSISNSTFANNSAGGGAGLYNADTMSISNSTFASNSATELGGGLGNVDKMSISNSTFVSNSAGGDRPFSGGGLYNGGIVSISNSTISGNSAGGGLENRETASIGGSIVANNRGGNCLLDSGGVITSTGYNLESGTDCGFTGTGDLQNTDPQLDPSGLQSNGGPTQTIALLSSSPAIDRIPAASCPATDQRGDARLDNAETTCDMGAYEFSDPVDKDLGLTNVPANITVSATSSHGAVVTYTSPTVVDEDSPPPTASCSPASGSTFAIGTTTVTCTATDSDDTNSPVSGSFQVVVKDVTPPVLSLPANISVDATNPQGASVTYAVTATDPDDLSSQLTITCSPASGSTFAIGTTTVNCSASDPAGNSSSGSFQVVVKDVTPPALSLPSSPLTLDATSPQGATVSYTVTASDPDNAATDLTINCSPASGSTFAIGTTTVNCTAKDPSGNSSSGSFQVVVNGAATQVSSLITTVNGMGLSSSLQTALDNKLQDVLTAINGGQTATACSELTDFTGFVQSHTGKGITQSQATQLIAAAKQVQAVLGC